MTIFGPKPWVNPFGKMLFFRLFQLHVFIAQKGVFSFENIVKDILLAYIAKKKNFGSMAVFGPKPWVNPFGKNINFSTFRSSCFHILERRFFALEYRQRHFPSLYRQTQNVGKMTIFGPKPWVNSFGKMSIFRLFELLVFMAQKGVFSLYNIVKNPFSLCIWPFLEQNHGLTPLEKCQIFDFLNLLFLQPRMPFFCCRISSKTFSWPILLQKKMEKWPFILQNDRLTCLEKCQFFDFLNFMFSWPILNKKKIGKMAIFGPKSWVNPFGKMSIFRLF